MTCREFKRTAAELGLQQVSRAQYPPMAAHAAECSQCESWMQEQRMLAGAMQTLSLRTSRCEAGVDVERALLRAFRQNAAARPAEPVRFPPLALRLSRWFGMGAYAAVAAAVLVGLFLGYRVWQHPATVPVQGQNSATVSAPVGNDSTLPVAVAAVAGGMGNTDRSDTRDRARGAATAERTHVGKAAAAAHQNASDDTLARADYVNLMFCDPLSCSSDEQVVRMELPMAGSADGQASQPVIADVVVGDDGLVRAMRIVN